jgi:hypothetical protein
MDTHPCVICAHPATKKCGACSKPYYCSKEHQEQAWPKHKRLCKIFQMSNPPDASTYCGLCGKQEPLRRTDCCNRTVCDDFDNYVPFSYTKTSCARNHSRYTICSTHKTEHPDENCNWRQCVKCKEDSGEVENFVGSGSSNFNFVEDQWDDAPTFEPTYCFACRRLVKLNSEGHARIPNKGIQCQSCVNMGLGR